MHFDWWTLALEAVNFLILVWLLQRFLYKPVMAVVARRRQEVDAAFAEATEARRCADAEAETYRQKRASIEEERLAVLATARTEIEEERQRRLGEARAEAEALLARQRQVIADDRAGAFDDLRNGAADLAVSLATALLRDATDGALAEAFLERLRQRLIAMSEADRARLLGPVGEPTVLRVVTAPALDEIGRQRWRQRLAELVGEPCAVAFDVDDGLVAGARIHFPAAILELSWSSALKEARNDLVGDESAA